MFCKYCGSPMEDGSVFCGNCGKKADSTADTNGAAINRKGLPIKVSDHEVGTKLVTTCMEYIQKQMLDMSDFWKQESDSFVTDFKTLLLSDKKTVNKYLKRGYFELSEQQWEAAKGFFNDALDEDVECAEAYLGLVLCDIQVFNFSDILSVKPDFIEDSRYKRMMRFATEEKKKVIQKLEGDYLRLTILTAALISERIEGFLDAKGDSQKLLSVLSGYFDESFITKERNYLRSQLTDDIMNDLVDAKFDIYMHRVGSNVQEVVAILQEMLGTSRDSLFAFLEMIPAYIKRNASYKEMIELQNRLLAAGAEIEARRVDSKEEYLQEKSNTGESAASQNTVVQSRDEAAQSQNAVAQRANTAGGSIDKERGSWDTMKEMFNETEQPNEMRKSCRIGGGIKGRIGSGRSIPLTEVERLGESVTIVTHKLPTKNYKLNLGDIRAIYLKKTMSPFWIFGIGFGVFCLLLFWMAEMYAWALIMLLPIARSLWIGRGNSIVIENVQYGSILIPCRYPSELGTLDAVLRD